MNNAIRIFTLILISFHFSVAFENTWKETGSTRFGILDSLERCQGVTNDQNGNVWFSANKNLLRTANWADAAIVNNGSPFSSELTSKGSNHIGDIDFANGQIIAPIEDGSTYKNPYIGFYDSASLKLNRLIQLNQSWQPDGVPWVTVDPTHNRLITAQYSNTTRINIYDLGTGNPIEQIPMNQTLNSIQGGKYWNGHLYMTANDPAGGFAVFDMDLISGNVQKMIHLNNDIIEIEGLTFLTEKKADLVDANITDFFILSVSGSGFSRRSVLYHWTR